MKWDVAVTIDGYFVEVQLKKKDGVYYANANNFFLVATTGDNENECLNRLITIFLRIREFIFKKLIESYGIEKASPI